MFGLSFWEIAIILMVALIILGPKKLPELARSLGKGIREFRKATDDFKSSMDYEMNKPEPPRKQLTAEAEDAEILPSDDEADAKAAQAAQEEAKKAVEAAQANAAPTEAAPEPEPVKTPSTEPTA